MQIMEIGIAVLVAGIVMVLHEFPKSLFFFCCAPAEEKRKLRGKIFKLHQYIDPVGLLLSVTSCAGFSKPFMFRVRSQKKNLMMGISGFCVLIFLFLSAVYMLRTKYGLVALQVDEIGLWQIAEQLFWIYLAILSGSMFLVNLFPVSVFDMGLLIAGTSASRYFRIVQMDTVIKIILLLAIALDIIRYFTVCGVEGLLAL